MKDVPLKKFTRNPGGFVLKQFSDLKAGGFSALKTKVRLFLGGDLSLVAFLLVIIPVLMIRLLRPIFHLRISRIISSRIGHMTSEVELYASEIKAGINKPNGFYLDLFYYQDQICNTQLGLMWKRELNVLPSWILSTINKVNRRLPGWEVFEALKTSERDYHNLLDSQPATIKLNPEEEKIGQELLEKMGIPVGALFVCLNVRDAAYLSTIDSRDFSYHDYRDSNIQNYVLAAEELANRGFYVIRMGAVVREKINSNHPKVIDYAANGMRSDFMDIYLGAKCHFCLSTGAGWDGIPYIFRRPTAYASLVPIGGTHSFRNFDITISKHHWLENENRKLNLKEIFELDAGFFMYSQQYKDVGIKLIENTPEEIRDIVIEMAERLSETWKASPDDEELQKKFWSRFDLKRKDMNGRPYHGPKIVSRYSTAYLRNNPDFLE